MLSIFFSLSLLMTMFQSAAADLITVMPTVGPEYGYVIAVVALLCFQCTVYIFSVAGPRYKHMTPEYIKKHLSAEDDELKKMTGKSLGRGCHPDNGLGRLSDKLDMEAWMEINIAQRVAGNYMENITQIVVYLLLSGLFMPLVSAVLGVCHLIGRVMYGSGFKSKSGTGARVPGFAICMLSYLVLFLSSVFCGIRMTGSLSSLGL